MNCHSLTIPLPPSINSYYGANGNKRYIKPKGVAFRQEVALAVKLAKLSKLEGKLWLSVRIFPRDRRACDLDNFCKSLQDSLMHAGLFDDDSQIDSLEVKRGAITPGGLCEILIGVINAKQE